MISACRRFHFGQGWGVDIIDMIPRENQIRDIDIAR